MTCEIVQRIASGIATLAAILACLGAIMTWRAWARLASNARDVAAMITRARRGRCSGCGDVAQAAVQ